MDINDPRNRRAIFGWHYPPGTANDPNAPWNQIDPPCELCGETPGYDCECPECPVCGEVGNPACDINDQ